jgi:lipopolysaccharide transport system ATP-binding protein
MGDVVVKAERLGKRYQLAQRRQRSDSLAETLTRAMRDAGRGMWDALARRGNGSDAGSFWALRDVSFEVKRGEVLGLIGRNGAGKSTLLKLLSRITEPTTGWLGLRGRVASLLEVGTGFHPELTGRENIYLNGAILGMRQAEIRRKFDEIVAFAEVDQFLETPVKRYSSGMYVRLAFAVAAHLEPEILIIDEVLAVGDAEFQNKCLGKLGDVVHDGRTVLFVSHNMTAVSALCDRVIVMEQGRAAYDGLTQDGIERYSRCGAASSSVDLTAAGFKRHGPGEFARLASIALFDRAGAPCESLAMGDPLTVELTIDCARPKRGAEVGFVLANLLGTRIHLFVSTWEGLRCDLALGRNVFRATIPHILAFPGSYTLTPWVTHAGHPVDDQVDAAISFSVVGKDLTGHNPSFERYAYSKCETYCPSVWSCDAV